MTCAEPDCNRQPRRGNHARCWWCETTRPKGKLRNGEAPAYCTVTGCSRTYWASGLCRHHYDKRPDGPRCEVDGCQRAVKARGWCRAHYTRWLRTGDVQAHIPVTARKTNRSRRIRNEKPYFLKDRIVDIMDVDPGWWTIEGLALRFDAHPDSVKRVLKGLEDDGVMERRHVVLATSKPGDRSYDKRIEWRLADV